MKKIYIAGKITGECETPELMQKCNRKFMEYGFRLGTSNTYLDYKNKCHFIKFFSRKDKIMFTNGLLINKELIESGKGTYSQYLKNDIAVMLICDEVHFLPDWQDSNGARLEHHIAEKLEMTIIYSE